MRLPGTYVPSIYTLGLLTLLVGLLLFVALLQREIGLTVFCLTLFGVLVGCRIWSHFCAPGFQLSLASDRLRLFPGDEFQLTVKAENSGLLPLWAQVGVPRLDALDQAGEQAPDELNTLLPPLGSAELRWRLTARQRGVYFLGPNQVLAGDFMGFYPRQIDFQGGVEILIYPRLVPVKLLDFPKKEMFGSPGARHPVVDPVYIIGTRDYQPGRPARFIHWRASARHNRWQEKLFEPSAQAKILITLDVTGFAESQATDEFERALEVVASLAVELERRGSQVGFFSNGLSRKESAPAPTLLIAPLEPKGAPSPPAWQTENILEALARLEMRPTGPIHAWLSRYPGLLRGTSLAHCAWEMDQACGFVRAFAAKSRAPFTLLLAGAGPSQDIPGPSSRGVLPLGSLTAGGAS